jgi:hypothetical protein
MTVMVHGQGVLTASMTPAGVVSCKVMRIYTSVVNGMGIVEVKLEGETRTGRAACRTTVEYGLISVNMIEVRDGLIAGDRVILSYMSAFTHRLPACRQTVLASVPPSGPIPGRRPVSASMVGKAHTDGMTADQVLLSWGRTRGLEHHAPHIQSWHSGTRLLPFVLAWRCRSSLFKEQTLQNRLLVQFLPVLRLFPVKEPQEVLCSLQG